jgi:hypothetical protein
MITRPTPRRDRHNVILGPPERLYTALMSMTIDSSGWLICPMESELYIPEALAMAEKGFVYTYMLPYPTTQDWGLLELFVSYPNGETTDSICFIAPFVARRSGFNRQYVTVPKGAPNLLNLLRNPVHHNISSKFPEFTHFYEDFLKYKNE